MADRLDERVAAASFAVACAVGLIGAFVGLQASSFWTDELFTAWVVGADGNALHALARAATDVHPPVYYGLIFLFSRVAGDSDVALRLFSALCACAAIGLFILGGGRAFSLPARLFAAAMATGSIFWFDQSQNARDYSLSLLIGTGLLLLSLRVLSARRLSVALAAPILVLMVVGSFVHFYLMFECVAVGGVMAIYVKRHRLWLLLSSATLVGVSEAYTKLIIYSHTKYAIGHNWIQNTPRWYGLVAAYAVHSTVSMLASVALVICLAGWILRVRERRLSDAEPRLEEAAPRVDPAWALCLGVPAFVIVAGVASSIVLSPNLTDRNVLVCSPFLWAALAKTYDSGVFALRSQVRALANLALAVIVLFMSTIVAGRTLPRNEPFRESADWIRTLPQCRGQAIPVIDTDDRSWADPGWTQAVVSSEYGRYLAGYARPQIVYASELKSGLPADLAVELGLRLDGKGCPVLGWNAHALSPETIATIERGLAASTNRGSAWTVRARSFDVYDLGLVRFLKRPGGYVFYAGNRLDRRPL